MSRALLRKELREHGAIIAASLAFAAAGLAGLLILSARTGGRFSGLTQFALAFGLLLALIISNRLFVREYAGRTQLFLETLPLSRGRVFATKWLLGGSIMLVAMAASWYGSLEWIRRHEVLSLADAVNTLVCVLLLALALWSFAVMAAMLGRYRYLVWVIAWLGYMSANVIGGIAFGELPLMRLLGPDVAMARGLPPLSALWQAAAIAFACTLAATALALYGSGAMASTLAQRMTPRERAFILVALMVLVGITTTLQPKVTPPPFELQNVEARVGKYVRVSVLDTVDLAGAAADELADTVIRDVDSLVEALQLRMKPAVFIQPQQGLDPMAMRRAWLGGADGIVLKAAPDAPRDLLRELVLHSVLLDATSGRAEREDRHVLLDGLAAYWSLRDDLQVRAQWWLRAASISTPVQASTLQQWSKTSEQVGECVSQALAFAAMDVLATQLGREELLALMRTLFVRPYDDVRVLFETAPIEHLRGAGVTWSDWAARTEKALAATREQHAELFARRTALKGAVTQHRSAARGLTLEAQVSGVPEYWVLYRELGPWTADVIDMTRLDARGPRVVLPVSLRRGTELLTVIEANDAELGCPVRLFAQRMELR